MKTTIYACQLIEVGLPAEGLNWNGVAFPNYIAIVQYMALLDDCQKCTFLSLITEQAFQDGYSSSLNDE